MEAPKDSKPKITNTELIKYINKKKMQKGSDCMRRRNNGQEME